MAAVLTLICTASDASAQRGQSARLNGTVTDETGAVLAGVKLTASSPQLIGGPHLAESDETGIYRFPVLPPGTYVLAAAHPGFEQVSHRDIELPVGLALTVDVRLRLTSLSSRVDVEGVVIGRIDRGQGVLGAGGVDQREQDALSGLPERWLTGLGVHVVAVGAEVLAVDRQAGAGRTRGGLHRDRRRQTRGLDGGRGQGERPRREGEEDKEPPHVPGR